MLLPLDMLVAVYMHLISAMLVFGANVLSQSYIEEEIDIVHNNGVGRGSLYESHIEFMKAHLYENNNQDNGLMNNGHEIRKETQQSDNYLHLLNLPITIASLFKLSPLIKRQVNWVILRFVQFILWVSETKIVTPLYSYFPDYPVNVLHFIINVGILVFKFGGGEEWRETKWWQ